MQISGGARVSVDVGWFEATVWFVDGRVGLRELHCALDVELVPQLQGFKRYPIVFTGGKGVWLGVSKTDDQELHVQIKQTAGEALGPDRLRRLAEIAGGAQRFKFSRLDLAANDHARRVTPEQVDQVVRAGDVVTRVRPENRQLRVNHAGGQTFYLGSPKGEHMLRVYDKDHEVAIRTGQYVPLGMYGIRWENELRNAAATDTASLLWSIGRHAGRTASDQEVMWAVTTRLADFRDRASNANAARRRRLDWWQSLTSDVAKAELERDRGDLDIDRRAAWFLDQIAPTYALLEEHPSYGPAFLEQALADGRRRLGLADQEFQDKLQRRNLA